MRRGEVQDSREGVVEQAGARPSRTFQSCTLRARRRSRGQLRRFRSVPAFLPAGPIGRLQEVGPAAQGQGRGLRGRGQPVARSRPQGGAGGGGSFPGAGA